MKKNVVLSVVAIGLLAVGFWGGRAYQKRQTAREISTVFGVQNKTPEQIHQQQLAAQQAVKDFQARVAASSEAAKVATDDAMLKAQQDQAAALQQINRTLYEDRNPTFAQESPTRILVGSQEYMAQMRKHDEESKRRELEKEAEDRRNIEESMARYKRENEERNRLFEEAEKRARQQ